MLNFETFLISEGIDNDKVEKHLCEITKKATDCVESGLKESTFMIDDLTFDVILTSETSEFNPEEDGEYIIVVN